MRARLVFGAVLMGAAALAGCGSSEISGSAASMLTEERPTLDPALPDPADCADPEVYEGWTEYCANTGVGEPPAADDESDTETAAPNPRLGETFTYENGVAVTVSPPQPFTPSNTAAVSEPAPPAFIVFDITVANAGSANYDPAMFTASLQSGSTESEKVFDSANGVGGTPTTTVLPGREVVFRMAFGVTDPADLVMELAPGFEYESVIFTS